MKKFLLLALLALTIIHSKPLQAASMDYTNVNNTAAINTYINTIITNYSGTTVSDPNCFANTVSTMANTYRPYQTYKTNAMGAAMYNMLSYANYSNIAAYLTPAYESLLSIKNVNIATVNTLISWMNGLLPYIQAMATVTNHNDTPTNNLLSYANTIIYNLQQLLTALNTAVSVVKPLSPSNQSILFNMVQQTHFMMDNFLNPNTGAFITPNPLTYNQIAHSNEFQDFGSVNSNPFIQNALAIYTQINGQSSALTCSHVNQLNTTMGSISALQTHLSSLMTALYTAGASPTNATYYAPAGTNPNETEAILQQLADNINLYIQSANHNTTIQLPNYASQLSALAQACSN